MTARKRSIHAPSLRRREPFREPRKIVLIVCGGATERAYFEMLVNEWRVLVTLDEKGYDPKSLVKYAIGLKKERFRLSKRSDVLPFDEVWCVLDAEGPANRPPTLSDAKQTARDNGIDLAISEPCFEFWHLLHFEFTTASFKNCDEVIRRLKKHLPTYGKAQQFPNEFLPRVDTAISNSQQIRKMKVPTDSHTDVDLVVSMLKDMVESASGDL